MTNNCLRYVFSNKLNLIQENSQECVNYKNSDGISTLMMASLKGNDLIVDYLLSQNVDLKQVDSLGQNALSYAVLHDQVSTSRLLVAHGIGTIPNNYGITPLMYAVQKSDLSLVKALNPSVNDINIRASDGWTALYFSIRERDQEVFDYLVESGACSSLKDDHSQTPYDFAVEVGWSYAQNKLKKTVNCEGIAKN